jgi:hypothetical protein
MAPVNRQKSYISWNFLHLGMDGVTIQGIDSVSKSSAAEVLLHQMFPGISAHPFGFWERAS